MSLLQTYNGLDCVATFQLYQDFLERYDSDPALAAQYDHEIALMAPALHMMTRGLLVDQEEMAKLREVFTAENKALEAKLDVITKGLRLGVINMASPVQKIWLLECLGAKIPTKYDPKTGKSRKTVERDALEKISLADPELAPICNILMAWSNRAKMLTVLQPELIDRDGRMRTGYKVSATVTDRWSSGKNALWTGMNMQNIKRDEDEEEVGHASIRSMFIADPGHKFINVDLKGADTWAIALEIFIETGDKSLLNMLLSGDVHTQVAKMVWPGLGWTGDKHADKKIAEQFFYRQYDYRFMCKKGGHGTNYYGSAAALAMQMKIPRYVAENFQAKYFQAIPGLKPWQHEKIRQLQTTAKLTNLYGRERRFHKRLDDNKTHKEAIAWCGQSVTSGTINRAILRVWDCQIRLTDIIQEVLAQVHDSLLGQFPEAMEAEVIDLYSKVMLIPIEAICKLTGEIITISIPLEISTGWNWAKASKSNPDGLVEYKGTPDARCRTRTPKITKPRFMDRRVSGIHERRIKPVNLPQVGGNHDSGSGT